MEGILKALTGSAREGLTDAQKLEIGKEVERHLKNLPVETYQAVNALISQRVAEVESRYRTIAWIAGVALVAVAGIFFKVTAENAADKVTEMLAQSEAAKKVEELAHFHREGAESLNALKQTATNISQGAAQLAARLAELENADNIVRYAADGNIRLRTTDPGIWFEGRGGRGLKGYFGLYQFRGTNLTVGVGPNSSHLTPLVEW
jgi:hypothetical protein